MLIKRLEIKDMRKIKQVEIDFHGPGTQVIEGVNQAGKSTIGQAIAITMNGTKDCTPGMIRRGAEQAEIIGYTDDGLKIRTVIDKTVKQSVARYDEDLMRHVNLPGGVRTFLDSICSGLEHPWSLRDLTDADIIETIMSRSGASEKIAAIDAALADKERLRTETGRDRKREGELGKAPHEVKHPDPIDGINDERQKAREYADWRRRQFIDASDHLRKKCVFNSLEEIEIFRKEVDEANNAMIQCLAAREAQTGKAYTQEDIDCLDKQIADWYEIKEKAKTWDSYLQKKERIEALDKRYNALTAEIEELRAERKKVLSDMKLGIRGLEIGEDNTLYHNGIARGITKSQKTSNWSTAESVQIFFGLGARFSGKMKVLVVDNAESLDAKTTGTITEWAEQSGFLVILLRVSEMPEELEDGVIYIREGEIVIKEAEKTCQT